MEKVFPGPRAKACHDVFLRARKLVLKRKKLSAAVFIFGIYNVFYQAVPAVLDDSQSNWMAAGIAAGALAVSIIVGSFILIIANGLSDDAEAKRLRADSSAKEN